jgi:predicted transcriptional regulator of viral defense system
MMKRTTSFQIAKPDIVAVFEEYEKQVLDINDISEILNRNRKFWRLPRNLTKSDFVNLLTKTTDLKSHEFDFPRKKYTRFTWRDASLYRLALSLERDSYFTHYTALYWHNLTDQVPKTIYVNYEQAQKRYVAGRLIQENIDIAFRNPQRESRNIAMVGDFRVCLVNGKYTNRLGVTEITTDENEKLRLTDLERTLIDIVVRPTYSGGIYEVLNAYRAAAKRVSINKLTAMLRKLNYIYPYHQAIGFYLERVGVYKEAQIGLLKTFNFEYDFYLTHKMGKTEYSKEWRLYYPMGF